MKKALFVLGFLALTSLAIALVLSLPTIQNAAREDKARTAKAVKASKDVSASLAEQFQCRETCFQHHGSFQQRDWPHARIRVVL